MEQRDFLIEQIEQMGRVLAKVLSAFLGYKSNAQASLGIEVANKQLKSELDIDISKLKELSKDELKDYLQERKFRESHLEVLAELFLEMGESKIHVDLEESNINLGKAIEILQIADEVSQTMSFSRMNKIAEIRQIVKIQGEKLNK